MDASSVRQRSDGRGVHPTGKPRFAARFIGTTPAKGKVRKRCESISRQTSRRLTFLEPAVLVERLNRPLRGWANYFRLGPVSKAWRAVDNHVTTRLRQWLCRRHHEETQCAKHKEPGRGWSRFPDEYTLPR